MVGNWKNKLYFGDNLEILRKHVQDESVDLVYLDPPFNSKADYNVLFKNSSGESSPAQATAFKDTWEWDAAAAEAFHELMTSSRVPDSLRRLMESLKVFLTGDTGKRGNSMMAYLTMMALRLVELHRVLKPTGSLYLHCDPTASHYLKQLLDATFGFENFRNEIVWKRTSGRKGINQFGRVHDVILFFTKSGRSTWNPQTLPQSVENARGHDIVYFDGIPHRVSDLSGAGSGPPREFGEWGEFAPPSGRHWMYDQEGIDKLLASGRIILSKGGRPRLRTPIDDLSGISIGDCFLDIEPINSAAQERLGYPTQKPEALLERLIRASSSEGDVVLDPFCGCGTTIAVAEKLKRRWIGIDVT